MKKYAALMLCAALLLGMLSGCAEQEKEPYVPTGDALVDENADLSTLATEPEKEQDLTLVYYPQKTLHPFECTDYTNKTVLSLVYQSLFVVDDNYEVHPLLCEYYSVSEDMMTYTFYIDRDATFSDGTPVTADLVADSFNEALDSYLYSARFYNKIQYIETVGGNGVAFHLIDPYENFPILLDVPIIKVEPSVQPAGEGEQTEEKGLPIGSGPYYFDTTNVGIRLLRTVNWWCNQEIAINASSISLKAAENPIQIRDEFEFGDVGLVCADPGADNYADFRCDYELWDIESGIMLYIGFNQDDEGESVFKDDALRAAVTYAINRQQIVDDYFRGYAVPSVLPASPYSPFYDEGLADQYGYDPDRFRQAVSAAGLQGEEISLLVNGDDSLRTRIARDIKEMLEACGIKVAITEWTGGSYVSAVSARQYDLYLAQTKLSVNMDLTPFFYIYGTLSYGALDNDAAYALCLESLKNEANYYNLHKLVVDQGLICPILFRSYAVYATRGLLTGLTPARDNVFYYDLGVSMADIQIGDDETPDTLGLE